MKPNQEKLLKRLLSIFFVTLAIVFVVKHIVFFLISISVLIVLAFVIVKWLPKILQFFDDFKDFFSK